MKRNETKGLRFRERGASKTEQMGVFLDVHSKKATLYGSTTGGGAQAIVSLCPDGTIVRHNIAGSPIGLAHQVVSETDHRVVDSTQTASCPNFYKGSVCVWKDGDDCRKEPCLYMRK
jgi:hypothetical protein